MKYELSWVVDGWLNLNLTIYGFGVVNDMVTKDLGESNASES